VVFDPVQRRVVGRRLTMFHDLALHSERVDVPETEAATVLAQQVIAGSAPLKNWDNAVDQYIVRVNSIAKWFAELGLPLIGDAERQLIIEEICAGAFSYKEIKDRPVWPAVKSLLTPQQQQSVEQLVPERIELPNKRKAKITYSETSPPTVAARIQDLYGVERNLTIARGRITLVIQVLAPNNRPIQITSDLAGFWRDAYPKIKKELQRKYPKHEWR